jgi:hypothetical protein
MPIRPIEQIVVPPTETGAHWFTIEIDAAYVSREEVQERRRLGLPPRTFVTPERIAARRAPQYQIPPLHLPAEQLALWSDCVGLLNQAIDISREQEGPGTLYTGLVASRAWAVFQSEDIKVQQVRWVEADCYPAGIDPMTVLLESEAQLRDIIDNATTPATADDAERIHRAMNPIECLRADLLKAEALLQSPDNAIQPTTQTHEAATP